MDALAPREPRPAVPHVEVADPEGAMSRAMGFARNVLSVPKPKAAESGRAEAASPRKRGRRYPSVGATDSNGAGPA